MNTNTNSSGEVKHRYSKLDQQDNPSGSGDSQGPKLLTARDVWTVRQEKMAKILTWIRYKIEALLWVAAAAYSIYYTNFFKQLHDNEKINQFFLSIALICVGINVCMAIYIAVILPYVLKVKEDFTTYAPKTITIGAITGFFGIVTMIIAIWPVFGWWSPLLIFVMFMGYIMTGHFLPGNQLGSALSGLIFFGAIFSHKYIEHDGHF